MNPIVKTSEECLLTLFLCPYGWLWANNCSLGRLCGAAIVNFGITANGSVVWVTCFYMLRGRLRLSKSIINTYARYGKILSNIYDGAFFRKKLTAFSRLLFSQKKSIVDAWQGRKYIFKITALNVLKVKTLEPSQQHYTFIFIDFEHDLQINLFSLLMSIIHGNFWPWSKSRNIKLIA